MEFAGQVVVHKKGRNGQVVVALGGGHLAFYWEFGGGNCIARVEVPDPDAWQQCEPYRRYGRSAFLAGLAREIARLECPAASIEITEDALYFREQESDAR